MVKLKKTLKLIGVNLLVLVLIIAIMELALSAYFNLGSTESGERKNLSVRGNLPNYSELDWAEKYWEEYTEHRLEYHSYVGWKGVPKQGEHIIIDDEGYRNTINKLSETQSKYQIAFLGGSTMWGTGANDAGTIPSCFARLQDSAYVRNLGQLAYVAQQGYLALECEIAKGYQPQLVIAYDGVNNAPSSRTPFSHSREEQIRERMVGADSKRQPEALWATKRVIQGIKRRLIQPESNESEPHTGKERLFAVDLLESWLALKVLCDANNIDFLLVLQPNIGVGSPDVSNLGKAWKELPNGEMLRSGTSFYQKVNEILAEERYSVLMPNFLDLTNVLDHIPNVYIDHCHLSPNGNEIIAEAINNQLISLANAQQTEKHPTATH